MISPDLTYHDPATLGNSGGPLTKDQTSVEYYATIFVDRGVAAHAEDESGPAPTTARCISRATAA